MINSIVAKNNQFDVSLLLGVVLLVFPLLTQADAIIPYMVVPWGQVFLFPIVVIVESIILKFMLGGTILFNLLRSFIANLLSTLIGTILYMISLPIFGGSIFRWWFNGGFSTDAVRGASIALVFASLLWVVSWISETFVISHMRFAPLKKNISHATATANLVTYVLLLFLSLWVGRDTATGAVEKAVDLSRNSNNIESLLIQNTNYPFIGFWKTSCTDNFGLVIEAEDNGKYTISFCGPGACDRIKPHSGIMLENDASYRIVDNNTIEELPSKDLIHRCNIPLQKKN